MLRAGSSEVRELSRRAFCWQGGFWLGGALVAVAQEPATAPQASGTPPSADCPRCGGLGVIPQEGTRPLVWITGQPLPRPETFLDEQDCPICTGGTPLSVEQARQQIEAVQQRNQLWSERTGWRVVSVATRHAAVHGQLTPSQARSVGQALEALTLHLKAVTGTLVLTPTRPTTFEMFFLWERSGWDRFRSVLEKLYTLEQLGAEWAPARDYNAYDHAEIPHWYETPQSVRGRPPSCGAVFLTARRQLILATARRAPFWLREGFAAYGDYRCHGSNRWYSVYDVRRLPVGDWMAEARRAAAEDRLRPWEEVFHRELRDWEWLDHVQTLAMTAFLLETQPSRFLELVRRLRMGEALEPALTTAYRRSTTELAQQCSRWLLARR